jgi:HupE / UreJ protein
MSHQPLAVIIAAAMVALFLLWSAATPAAHEIPNDVTVQTMLKPEGQRLRLLVRVPLVAMRDMAFPQRGIDRLDLARAEQILRDAAQLWVADDIEMYEDDVRLAYPRIVEVRASLAGDRSFTSYDEALAHVTGPRLPDDTEFFWSQGLLDILFEYRIRSDQSKFSIRPKLARLGIRTQTVLRFLPPGGAVRAFEFHGDPGLVRLDPRWHQAAFQFVKLGFFHILDGVDHLLFLVCLVIPFRRFRSLVAVVTAFTVAHSITLVASAYNLAPDALWFPPLIETLIATSIVYMALENIVFASRGAQSTEGAHPSTLREPQGRGPQRGNRVGVESRPEPGRGATSSGRALMVSPSNHEGLAGLALKRRWLVTFAFGLVHGFGFSFALRETLQFAGSHLLTSLLAFNVGVELGQLLVLVVLIPALGLLFRYVVAERLGTIILSAIVAHTAWHWMTERFGALRQYRFEWPVIDLAFWVGAMRLAMLVVVCVGLYWLFFGVMGGGKRRHDARDAA